MKSSKPESEPISGLPATLAAWLALIERRHHSAIDLGLDRAAAVWERMGRPLPARRIFVVAGTNGKGSTVATICSLLGALGYRYGCYTTPHIHRYNERVQVQGEEANDDDLVRSFHAVEAALGGTSLSYFEFGTLAAFELLSRRDLDFAVMEIGLGGRLDAVNLLDADCSVITPIGLDHQEYLGDDRETIGLEKAGIIRPGRPLVLGDPDPPSSVLERARALGSPVTVLGRDYAAEACSDHACFRFGDVRLDLPAPTLRGAHQFDNAATALAAVLTVLPAAIERGDELSAGLSAVDLHGRFERVHEAPDVWIDVGHNPMGARVIAQALRERGAGSGRTVRCVLGMLQDKDAEAVAAELKLVISEWYCAGLTGYRGQEGVRLAERISAVVEPSLVAVFGRVPEALSAALERSAPEDGVLVFGSFHTADEADRMMVHFTR